MKKIILLYILCAVAGKIFAQKQTFDITSYTPPKGWKKVAIDKAIQFTKQDDAKGTYCIITLMKSIPGTENSKENFNTAWETVVKEMVKVSAAPEMQPPAKEDGWEAQSGYAPFESEGTNGIALLVTSTGYQKMVNILILTNTDAYEADMTAFVESLDFKKQPATTNTNKETTQPNRQEVKLAASSAYSFSTTNFDDGWTSIIKDDWVEVTKGNIKVYLLYALPFNASDFSGTGIVERDYYWDNYVTKYFNIQTKQYRDDGEYIGSLKPKYVEGWSKDKQTGERRFIAMRLSIAPNTAYLTIASTPDEKTMYQRFPNANGNYTSDLTDMSRYNKFAITANDITGQWQNGDTKTAQWYYVHPSGYESYAGMTLAATSATFNFNTGGSYTSIQNGATGAVGNMSTFQQNYKGTYSVSNWAVVATNRWQGKTAKFDASFMAVRGGRILKLNDNAGSDYNLIRTK